MGQFNLEIYNCEELIFLNSSVTYANVWASWLANKKQFTHSSSFFHKYITIKVMYLSLENIYPNINWFEFKILTFLEYVLW